MVYGVDPLVEEVINKSFSEKLGCLDLSNTQGELHDLPKDADSWLPLFSGKGLSGNSHWALLPPYTHLGDVEEIFNPLDVSLGASES
jgi:hypothetical protein